MLLEFGRKSHQLQALCEIISLINNRTSWIRLFTEVTDVTSVMAWYEAVQDQRNPVYSEYAVLCKP